MTKREELLGELYYQPTARAMLMDHEDKLESLMKYLGVIQVATVTGFEVRPDPKARHSNTRNEMTLNEIGLKHGTDKSSSGHNYLNFYSKLFPMYGICGRILEIGVATGASLKTWKEYFGPSMSVVGVDCHDESAELSVLLGNAYSEDMIECLSRLYHGFNIIIDDGSHDPKDIEWFFRHYHRILSSGGIMIAEDCPRNGVEMPEELEHCIVNFKNPNPNSDNNLILAWKRT